MIPAMRAFLLVLLSVAAIAEERWFSGTLGGQPLASMRQVERDLGDGRRESLTEMLIVIRRAMPGRPELRLEMRQTSLFTEDASGAITAFRFDDDQNGTVASASGTVVGRTVRGTLARLGRTEPVSLDLPEGTMLIGDVRSQELLVQAALAPGRTTVFASLALLQNQVQVITSTATARGTAGESLLFDVVADAMPLPMRLRLAKTGELQGMTMNLGVMALELKPAAGPVALLGAELPPTGLVKAAGPVPARGHANRVRIPPGATPPANAFQSGADGIVTLRSTAEPGPVGGDFLGASPQLELDDPALRAWVAANGPGAERLCLAVRSHIDKKDLMKGDASALETFRTKQGDCTEHATLLCAALRIAGIPARIEVGLVYAADYGGWVGHAWNQAYVDGRWVHLDSAYPGIPRSCYLGLGFADGLGAGAALLVQLDRFIGKTIEVLP